MTYRTHRGFGDAGPVPATTEEQAPTVADKTPPFTRQALSLMGVAALPWVPVLAGAWAGDKILDKNGKTWGAAGGFAVSFLAIRHFMKKWAGAIT